MHMIELVLLVLYSTGLACALFIIHCHMDYFYERFQKGVVSVFMLAMLFFLLAYTFKMLLVLVAQLAVWLGADTALLGSGLRYAWAIAQLGITGGLLALAVLTRSGKYDQYIHIKKIDRKKEQHADSNSRKK